MHPQRPNIPLQGLDRRVLTIRAISGPHCQIGVLHWCHFTSCGFTWSEKALWTRLWRSRSVDISQWRQWTCIVINFSAAISWGNKTNFSIAYWQTRAELGLRYIYAPKSMQYSQNHSQDHYQNNSVTFEIMFCCKAWLL